MSSVPGSRLCTRMLRTVLTDTQSSDCQPGLLGLHCSLARQPFLKRALLSVRDTRSCHLSPPGPDRCTHSSLWPRQRPFYTTGCSLLNRPIGQRWHRAARCQQDNCCPLWAGVLHLCKPAGRRRKVRTTAPTIKLRKQNYGLLKTASFCLRCAP